MSVAISTILLAGATASFLVPRLAQAQQAPLQVFAHRVHKTVAVGSQGGDVTAAWTRQSNTPVEWTTFDTGPLQERLFREATLGETSVDFGFVLNTQAVPRTADLFESLDGYLARDPVEDIGDVFPGLIEGMKVERKDPCHAIPPRLIRPALERRASWRNAASPSRRLRSRRWLRSQRPAPTGGPTAQLASALCMPGVTYPNVIDLARAWDGDFITHDFKVVADQPGMLNAIRLLRDLFQAGAFPRNFASLTTEDVATWMQQGRAAMALQSMGRNRIYNDPQKSRFPGKIQTGDAEMRATVLRVSRRGHRGGHTCCAVIPLVLDLDEDWFAERITATP